MRGDFEMLRTLISLASICSVVHCSGVHHLGAPIGEAPVVTAASSQYFERTFNRLVAAPPLVPVASAPPVFVQTAQALPASLPQPQVFPFQPVQPVQQVPNHPAQLPQPAQPADPNVAIAIATAHAAPVATILLPPYPFGFPPGYGFIPQEQPSQIDEKSQIPEQTTTQTTTQVEVKTTSQEQESTTPLPAASDNNFSQASSNQDINFKQYLAPVPPRPQAQPSKQNVNFRQYLAPAPPRPQGQPSNQNVNFRQYLAPTLQRPQVQKQSQPSQQQLPYALPQPLPHHYHHDHHHPHVHQYRLPQGKPQKLKTLVEIVKAPLAYIAPPPLPQFHHDHEAVKIVKHVHTFVPARAKLIIRPVSHHHIRSVPVKVIDYKSPLAIKAAARVQTLRPGNSREAEFTTFRSFLRPNTKPPRV